jgi:hypothetical protein
MVPYRTAFVPEAPVPIMPPICAPGAGSTGKKSGIPRSFSSAFRASYDTPGCTTASRSCSVDGGRVFQQRILNEFCFRRASKGGSRLICTMLFMFSAKSRTSARPGTRSSTSTWPSRASFS